MRGRRLLSAFGALALFTVLAVAHTWPIAARPHELGRNSNADTQLNAWTMAWVAHQVVRDPFHLFDANIFHPEKRTLAFSEHLVAQSIFAAPVRWAGGSAILAYNVALIAGFALSGWTTTLVIQRWTGSWPAGILAGSLMAFNALTLTRLAHIQLQHMQFFPFVLFAFDALLQHPTRAAALRLAGWYVLQSLTSVYFMVFTAVALAGAGLTRPREWAGARARIVMPLVLLAAMAAGLMLLPIILPYLAAQREQIAFVRTLREVGRYSATWTDYLATGGTWHHRTWSGQYFRADGLFPGATAILFTTFAVSSGLAFRDRRARMALAFGVLCFCLSFGPAFPLYQYLYTVFPPMAGLRGAARFGQFVLAAFAILSGFGLAALLQRFPGRAMTAVAIVSIAAANLEALRAPLPFSAEDRYRGVPPIFKSLDTPDPQVVVIFPFYPPHEIFMNARYMLVSTAFWHPMLNGYSGYMPVSYLEHWENLASFPDERSIGYLRSRGVTRVLVDSRNMSADSVRRLPGVPELSLIGTDGNLRIYNLTR